MAGPRDERCGRPARRRDTLPALDPARGAGRRDYVAGAVAPRVFSGEGGASGCLWLWQAKSVRKAGRLIE